MIFGNSCAIGFHESGAVPLCHLSPSVFHSLAPSLVEEPKKNDRGLAVSSRSAYLHCFDTLPKIRSVTSFASHSSLSCVSLGLSFQSLRETTPRGRGTPFQAQNLRSSRGCQSCPPTTPLFANVCWDTQGGGPTLLVANVVGRCKVELCRHLRADSVPFHPPVTGHGTCHPCHCIPRPASARLCGLDVPTPETSPPLPVSK